MANLDEHEPARSPVDATAPARPLRVLHVLPVFSASGGAETSMREILAHTEGPALRHALVVLQRGGGGAPTLEVAGIPVYEPGDSASSRLAQIRHVRSAIADFEPDLVTTAVFDADFAGRLAAVRAGVPVLTSLVNTADPEVIARDTDVKRWKLEAVRLVDIALGWAATTRFHAVTRAVAANARRRLHVRESRIEVVPRGRALDRLGRRDRARGAGLRRELGIAEDAFVLLNIAREEPQKGHVYLLGALARLRDDRDVHVVVAGRRGRASDQLDAEVGRLGVADAVHRLGYRSDIDVLHSAADAFVFPSNYEGIGGAVLEAMALGTPVIASEIPALVEVLDDGACGLLVPPADPVALAAAVRALVDDPAAARGRAEAAGQRFRSQYTIERCADGMALLYAETARLRPPLAARLLRNGPGAR